MWVTETENDIFGFEQYSGASPTPGTGPQDDFSKPGREFSFFTSFKQHVSCSVCYIFLCLYMFLLAPIIFFYY